MKNQTTHPFRPSLVHRRKSRTHFDTVKKRRLDELEKRNNEMKKEVNNEIENEMKNDFVYENAKKSPSGI